MTQTQNTKRRRWVPGMLGSGALYGAWFALFAFGWRAALLGLVGWVAIWFVWVVLAVRAELREGGGDV